MTEIAFSSSFKRAFKRRITGAPSWKRASGKDWKYFEGTPSIKDLELTSYPED